MHIAFRTSGGRGEYEVVGGAGGQSAANLEGWSFSMRWADGMTRDTLLWLDPGTSGKPRLRSLAKQPYQIGRMVAAMLLLPDPRRSKTGLFDDLPVLRRNGYIVTRVGFGPGTQFASPPDLVTFEPDYVEVANEVFPVLIGVDSRWLRIANVYAASSTLPGSVRSQLDAHTDVIASGTPITAALTSRVGELCKAMAAVAPSYKLDEDPLPTLEKLAGITPADGPELPPPDEIGEDEFDVRVEAAGQYRLAKMRDSSARAFAEAVKSAYHNRCAFCGLELAGIPGIRSGIDAAHILAWSSYDLDILKNGIALCKLHHWAFDAALMVPVVDSSGSYTVAFTGLAAGLSVPAKERLGEEGMVIPDDRLPDEKTHRPGKKYLRRLYDDLGVSF